MKRFFLLPICLFLSILCYSQEINIRSLKEIDGIQYTRTGENIQVKFYRTMIMVKYFKK